MKEVLLEAIGRTGGWAIVALFALYVGYQVYCKHSEHRALNKTLSILEASFKTTLDRIDTSIQALIKKLDEYLAEDL